MLDILGTYTEKCIIHFILFKTVFFLILSIPTIRTGVISHSNETIKAIIDESFSFYLINTQ